MVETYYPLIWEAPTDLAGDNKHVMNILINAKKGGLKPMTLPSLVRYAQIERERVQEAVHELAKRSLISVESWV